MLPLGGFVVLAFFGDWIRRDREETGAGVLACATVLIAFGLAALTTVHLLALTPNPAGLRLSQPYLGFDWMEAGRLRGPLSPPSTSGPPTPWRARRRSRRSYTPRRWSPPASTWWRGWPPSSMSPRPR